MKILFDNEIFLIQKYGGASRYFYELISRLTKKDIDISVYMGRFINEYGLENCRENFKEFFGKKIKHIPKTKLISIKLQQPLFQKFATKTEFDILHQTYFADLKLNKKHKRVITVHDFTHERLSENFSRLDKTAELKKKAIENSDGIICVSESTKKDLIERYEVKNKIVKVIYHGNSLQYEITEEPIIKEPYLLYVGDRRSYKNFGVMIKLFEINQLLKMDFKVICCGGGAFTKSEMKEINSKGLENNFIQIEARDKKIANLYKHAKAFIYPSKYEGFGIPVIEAMFNGCPVIASNVSSLPEVGGDSALYFNPDSVEDLDDKINFLLFTEGKRKKFIQKGKEREKYFSWDKCAEETFQFYKEVNEN